jgi:hypothetical protein
MMSDKVSTLYCRRSGLAIAQIRTLCNGAFPLVTNMQACMYHPIYASDLNTLLSSLKRELNKAEEAEWNVTRQQENYLKLHISAVMYKLGVLVDDYACLPSWSVVAAAGNRLYALAGWYHYNTSKRIKLPRYYPNKDNLNTSWGNLSSWVDAAFEVKEAWQTGKDRMAKEELLKARTEAVLEIKHEAVYKRIDLNKVWNWMSLQLSEKYSDGRLATWKALWMNGDIEQERWNQDDIEDLQFACIECCDVGNEIMHFISQRLKHIKEMIVDFYSSFTILRSVRSEASGISAHPDLTPEEKAKQAEFFKEYDEQAAQLSELPPEPQRSQYPTLAGYLRAKAQWNILARRFSVVRATEPTKVEDL